MANKQMNFSVGIKTTYDAAGVNKLKADLTSLSKIQPGTYLARNTNEIEGAVKAANALKAALTQAYNPKLGTATISRFNQSLKQSETTIKEVQIGLHKFGQQGDTAFLKATGSLLKLDTVAKTTSTTLDKMFITLKNTITWGMSSALWNSITGSIQKTYYYIKDLDTALNDIRIVTSKSNDEMAEFAKNANEAAKTLGTSTRNYAEGSLIYYQQGLSDEEVKTRTDITAKTAMVTGQSMDQVSEQLTAVWNGYKASAEEAELYVDRLAAVAATTASDLEELSVGMSKVASSAANLGVSESQLSAILATTISVTRQAPESVGTAYKTIFARISDIKAGLDTETTFGNYTSKMAEMGISVLDTTGNLRDMGEVIEEIGSKWQTMTREQQISLAQTMAGTRQYNNLVALFDNWDNYIETLNVAENAAGTLAEQHNIALDSINNRLNILKATWEDLYQNLITADDIKDIISAITEVADKLAFLVKSIGGLKTALPSVVSLFLQFASGRIGQEIGSYVNEFLRLKDTASALAPTFEELNKWKTELNINPLGEASVSQTAALQDMVIAYQEIMQYKDVMTSKDRESFNILQEQRIELGNISNELEDIQNKADKAHNNKIGEIIGSDNQQMYEFLNQATEFDFYDKLNGLNNSNDEQAFKSAQGLQEIDSKFTALITDMEFYRDSVHSTEETSTSGFEAISNSLEYLTKETDILTQKEADQLLKKFEELETQLGNDTSAFDAFINLLKRSGATAKNAANDYIAVKNGIENINEGSKKLTENLQVKLLVSDMTKLAGVLSSVGMLVNQISSLWKTWNDESLSTSEKMLRTFTAIGFILPSLLKTGQSIATFAKGITTAYGVQNGLLLVQLSQEERIAKLKEKETKEMEKQALLATAEDLRSAAKEEGHKAVEWDDFAKTLNMNSKSYSSAVSEAQRLHQSAQDKFHQAEQVEAEAKNLQKEIDNIDDTLENGVAKPGTTGTGLPGVIANLITTAPQAAAAIAALTAVLAVFVGTIAYVNYQQEKETKKQSEKLNKLKEESEEREKQSEKLKEVNNSYSQLSQQLSKNEITEAQYRNQVVALTKDLDDQTLKLKMLRGEYQGLDKDIKEALKSQNEKLIRDYTMEIDQAKATMLAAGAQGTKTGSDILKWFTGGDLLTSLIPGWGTVNAIGNIVKGSHEGSATISKSMDLEARYDIEDSLVKNLGDNVNTFGPGGIEIKNLDKSDKIIEIYEGINKTIQENAHLANTATIKELTQLRDNMQEAYDIQKEAQDKRTELLKENLANSVDPSTIKSQADFKRELTRLIEASMDERTGFFDEDEYAKARTWANGVLAGISDETLQWSKDEGLTDTILSSIEDLSKEEMEALANGLKDFSTEELMILMPIFYSLGQDSANSYLEGAKDFFKNVKNIDEIEEIYKKSAEQQKISSAIGIANQNKTFNVKEAQEMIQGTSLDTEQFKNMNYGNQMLTSLFTNAMMQKTPEDIAKIQEMYQEELDRINKENPNAATALDDYTKEAILQLQASSAKMASDYHVDDETGNLYFEDGEGNKQIELSTDKMKDLIEAYKDADFNIEKLSDSDKEYIEQLKIKGNLEDGVIEELLEQGAGYKDITDKVEALDNAIQQAAADERNWGEVREQAKGVMEYYSSSLDDVQSAYKSLAAAEKEWNLNEGFSVDTLQNLLKMNPMYLDALEMEGDQFKVNTERLNEVARAEAVASVNAWELQQQALLLQAVQDGENSAAWRQMMALQDLAGAAEDVTSALWAQVEAAAADKYGLESLQYQTIMTAAAQSQLAAERYRTIANKVDLTKDTKKSGKSSKKDEKDYRDNFDRYWEFLKAIDKVADAIDKLEKKEKNLFGREKISSLKTKNNLLKLQVKTYNDLFEEQKREQSELMGTLGSKGMTFNAEGEITNYAQKTSEALAAYNEAVRKYNAGMLSEEAFKIQEKAYEDFKKEVERYDKLYYSEMKDTLEKIEDIRRQVLANNLEAWEIEIKLKVDWGSLEREWADFLHNIEKDFTAVYEDLGSELGTILEKANTYSGDEGIISVDLKAIQDVMTEIDKLKAGGESNMFESISQAQEKLKELNSSLMKDSTDLKKLWEEAYKAYLQGIDQLNDKLEDQMERYEQIDKELAHQQKLIGLLYGDDAYSMMDTLYKNQEKNQLAEISSLRTQKDLWEDKWKAAEEGSQEQLKYYNLMIEAQNNLNASVEDYVELLQKDLANAVKETVDALDKSVTNGLGIDKVREQWDDLQDYNDGYFDENQRIFEIEKFSLTVEQKMADASAKTQKALKAFQEEELERLKKKEDLNEYDIKAAEYRLQLKEKELALEDAQNAKNSMKVTRDTNGNWTYQYVADEEDVANKQLDLIKATEDYYNFAKETHQKSLEDMMDLQEWYKEAIIEISTDMTLTQEEKEKRMQEATEKYERHAERLMAEANITAQDMAATAAYGIEQSINSSLIAMEDLTARQKEIVEQVCADNITDFQNLYKAVEDNNNNIRTNIEEMLGETVPEWQTAAQDMADAWNADDGASIKAMVTDAIDEILDYLDEYEDKLDELQDTAGMDFNDIVYNINEATDATEDLKDMIEELCNDNDLDDLKDIVDDLADSWDDVKDSIVRAIDKIKEYLRLMGQAQNASVNLNTPTAGGGNPGNSGNGNNNNSPGNQVDSPNVTPSGDYKYSWKISGGKIIIYSQSDYMQRPIESISAKANNYGLSTFGAAKKDKVDAATFIESASDEKSLNGVPIKSGDTLGDILRKVTGVKFDTGGYTGDWAGGDGRLAMLHSKELVLNADDTANFLSAVSMIREIASFGTSIENSIAAGVNSFMNRFSDSAYGLTRNETTNNTKQNVFNINAPITSTAATDEIQMAILQLPNLASQYVSRNGI